MATLKAGTDDMAGTTAVPSETQTEAIHTFDNTGYCLLSLDGGGVRGLSSLYILQGIMNRLNYMREEHGLKPRKPCEIFDLIGGTSTGGLIAIMLGRLEMTVEECIKAYTRMMKQIFDKKQNRSIISVLGAVKPRFSSQVLANAIGQVLDERGVSVDEKFENGRRGNCKVFVCTKFQKTNTTTRLRSYRTPSSSSSISPTILEAALATSAAPTYFSPASISSSHFIDGAIGANNPSLEMEEEAADLWCEETGNIHPLVKCFVSIGTGHQGIRSITDKGMKGLIETLRKEATETEKTYESWHHRWRDHFQRGRAFRFNVDHGLGDVKLAEFEEQDLLSAATATYLQKRGTIDEVRSCVENLRLKEFEPTVQFVEKLKKEVGSMTTKRAPQKSKATSPEILELVAYGTSCLHSSPPSLQSALTSFTTALSYLKSDPDTPPKQVSRLCQKLMETSLLLSTTARRSTKRRQHADQAREYAEKAVENARKANDDCILAQTDFMLACVNAWRVHVQGWAVEKQEAAGMTLEQKLGELNRFDHLDKDFYEEQARRYLGYLKR